MVDADLDELPSSVRGSRESVIERFGINGLYGFRSISLESEFSATILIAKNGTGKTTLLGALDAFLRRQFYRLRDLEFNEIYCKFRGEEELLLSREDVDALLVIPTEGELVKLSARIRVPPTTLFSFLTDEWPSLRTSAAYMDDTTFVEIIRSADFSYQRAREICDRLLDDLLSRRPRVATVSKTIARVLNGFDIVYLPTYRRVELALRREPEETSRTKKKPKFDVAAGSLFIGDIQFGLSDISERLAEMNNRIVNQSNVGYREISANIINELIDGSFEREPDSNREIPSPEELKLFFSRLEGGRRMRPFYEPVTIPNLDRIYSGSVPAGSGKFLNYFLNQLGKVIETTNDIERSVENFISSCNKYLLSEEASTKLSEGAHEHHTVDGKELRLNRQNLKVHVESVPAGRQISLDALSSGEKQMISLFAKMFLYEGEKIVLIDEPELSLSIDWQREILVDVLNAPLCRQVVAITHSPFVFDNVLEPFAKSLRLSDIA